jgi:tetratricopeptide (TPR) repeat protein
VSGESGLDPGRVAEVIATDADGAGRRGSGYLVTGWLVLTAAHVLAGAVRVRVRFDADRPGEWSAAAEPAWSDPGSDVALLRVAQPAPAPPGTGPEAAPVRFGRIGRPPVACEAMGFPLFKLRQEPPGPDGAVSQYRDSHHATGTVTSWSNRRQGTVEVGVRSPGRDPRPDRSPWEGMSGAAVFSGDHLIGVIVEHRRGDGPGTLAAYPVDRWYDRVDAGRFGELAALIGLPATLAGLAEVGAAGRAHTREPLHQLPAATAAFTGRARELADLLDLADLPEPGTVMISAIDGMAGIGKTALAIRAGHLLADRFPDGQLFVDLHGYTQGMAPRDPADVLAEILQAHGVAPARIPADPDARAALYRDRLAGTRTLIVLDNASGTAQIRPLLPAAPGCLVVVTSRLRLRGLDDARVLSLDLLPPSDAAELLRTVAGPARIAPGDPLLSRVAEWCGRLPLALRIAGALLRHRPSWTLERLAARLGDHQSRLAALDDDDRGLTAVFTLSYTALSYTALGGRPRDLFRLLGLHFGPDIDPYGAAALLGTDPAGAERLLDTLADHNLLAEPSPGRYRMHDLIRAHARALAAHDPADRCAAALERLLDYYQHTALMAEARLARHTLPEPPGPAPAHAPAFADADAARRWLRSERANLEGCLHQAAESTRDERLVALGTGLAALLRTDGPWNQALSVHARAADAAQRLGDRNGQARAQTELGVMRLLTGDYPGATRELQRALELSRELGDRLGRANALTELGVACVVTGDHPAAVRHLRPALELYRETGDRNGQARALIELGQALSMTGDYPAALRDLQEALVLHREPGDRQGRARALTELGKVRSMIGDRPAGVRDLQEALELYRGTGDRNGQARALIDLGKMRSLGGQYEAAVRDLHEGLELHRELGERNGMANVLIESGQVLSLTGDHPGAVRDLESAWRLYRELGNRNGQANALTRLGEARRLLGEHAGALRDLHEALGLFRELGNRNGQATALCERGQVLLSAGDHQGAGRDLLAALEMYRQDGSRGNEAWALTQYAAAVAAAGESARALAVYRDALLMTREVQQPDDEALALEGIGECLLRDGQAADGFAHLAQAREIFRRLGMLAHAERVRARLADLGGP